MTWTQRSRPTQHLPLDPQARVDMSTSTLASTILARTARSLNKRRESTDTNTPPTVAGNLDSHTADNEIRRPPAAQGRHVRHSHRAQSTFLPDFENPADGGCDGTGESFLPFGESETFVPRKTSVETSSANTTRAGSHLQEGKRQMAATIRTTSRSAAPLYRTRIDRSRASLGDWNSAARRSSTRPSSPDADRRCNTAGDPQPHNPTSYYGPRNESRSEYWSPPSSGDRGALLPVIDRPPPADLCSQNSLADESSDDWKAPLAPLEALEGFCDDETMSKDEDLAFAPLLPSAHMSNARRFSTLISRPSESTRYSYIVRPLARIRKLSGASKLSSSRSSSVPTQPSRSVPLVQESLSVTGCVSLVWNATLTNQSPSSPWPLTSFA